MSTIPTSNYSVEDRGYSSPCWIWNGHKGRKGYPMLPRNKNGTRYAHRWVYESIHGKQPSFPDHHLHHKCEVTSCINPLHLAILDRTSHRHTYNTKLDLDKAREIRRLYATGEYSQRTLSGLFRVSRATIINVLKDRIWREPEWNDVRYEEAKATPSQDMRQYRFYYS